MRKMGCVGREEFQVLWTIVASVSVPMMHDLLRMKASACHALHHETMLTDLSVAIRIRMIRHPQEYITATVNRTPATPRTVA